jgi:NAD(P)-dependent dehydrogenase (short-subunit alcohol dehydrogenase family)
MPDLALVCGAGGVLGSALVEKFLARGDRVVAVARRPLPEEVARGLRAEIADLSDANEVDALWARLDARGELPRWVVNAAGGYRRGSVAETTPSGLREAFDVNLATAWWSSRAAAQRLGPGSAIVNVGSRTAVTGGAGAAAYTIAKVGVVRLTEVLAAELADAKVRVNAVLPAMIDTPANRASMSPERMARAVDPAAIAAVIAFLCSAEASAVTGAIVPTYGWA